MLPETQPAGAAPLLEVHDLRTHIFTRRGVVKAVNGVSFQVRAGETLGLVGESGSGKTMTCLSILRLLPRGARIVSGEIALQGTNLTAASEATMERVRGKQIGMVLQNALAALDPVFTIGTQVGEPLVLHQHLSWRAALRRVVELLRMVKVVAPELRLHSYPHELSGGMRQRVASAAAIDCAPVLLIADEPTTALDVTTQRQYLDLLMELQQATGMAIKTMMAMFRAVLTRSCYFVVMTIIPIVTAAAAAASAMTARAPNEAAATGRSQVAAFGCAQEFQLAWTAR